MAHLFNNRRPYTPRVYHRDNFVELPHLIYRDFELRQKYRFGPEAIQFLTDCASALESQTRRSHALSVRTKVLITLRFLATGADYDLISENFGIVRSTVCNVIWDVIEVILSLKDRFINFSLEESDLRSSEEGFQDIGRFPKVAGCIDGTHVRIVKPSVEEQVYICRISYPSINVQVICDHKGKFNIDT